MNKEILLVDDEKTNARLIKMLLEMDGFKVTTSHNVTTARQNCHSGIVAFVIDYHLGHNEQGIDLLIDVRAGNMPVPPDTPVIITTGDHRQSKVAEEAGADKFMLKPYPPSQLSRELKKLLNL